MAARAIWKGVIRFEDIAVPVKLYSALEDRTIRFRLLHKTDAVPVRQAMVNPESDEVVEHEEIHRAWRSPEGDLVLLDSKELESSRPEKSRDIDVMKFLPPEVIDHRWYDRPYYLGPDGSQAPYAALTEALDASGREGLAHWVMRNKEYYGALLLHQGYPMLISLRYADQVVSTSELEAPGGKALDKRELDMARQLIEMLAASFEPEAYHDEYRERVEELIEKKKRGKKVKKPSRPKQKKPTDDVTEALEASLKGMRNGGEKRKTA